MDSICPLIKDLLPLYEEGLVSAESEDIIRKHLDQCSLCRESITAPQIAMREENTDLPLQSLKKKRRKKRLLALACGIVAGLIAVICIFSALQSPQFFPYSPQMLELEVQGDDVLISFHPDVTGFNISETVEPDGDMKIYTVEAWTSRWNSMLPHGGALCTTIPGAADEAVFYAQNNGGEDVCIHGSEKITWGMETLPALKLGYYVIIMVLLFLAFSITALVCRKKPCGKYFATAALYPASYLLSHIILGIGSVSYSFMLDFGLVLLCSVPIFILLLLLRELIKCFK